MLFKIVALFSGFLFGLGLMISGLVDPAKVIGFLDIFGHWDPSLAFVMGSALGTFLPGYFLLVRKLSKPVLSDAFCVNKTQHIDKKLLSGSLLFGTGWGLAGICPGPSVTALGSGSGMIVLFFASMVAGMYLVTLLSTHKTKLIPSNAA